MGFFKASLQSEIIAFSKEKRRLLNFERVQITNRVISCKQRLVLGDSSASSEIATLESLLKALILKDLYGWRPYSFEYCSSVGFAFVRVGVSASFGRFLLCTCETAGVKFFTYFAVTY